MTGKETYSYYSSDSERIANWLSLCLKTRLSPYSGKDNEERASLETRKDANALRALLGQAQANGRIYYEKTLDDFKKAKADEKDLYAHAALLVDGREIIARAERNRDNEKSVDLLMDGEYWEVKSPTADGTAANSLGFVEKNLKKAKRQFRDDPSTDNAPTRVVFNCRYSAVSDDAIESEIREKMHLKNVGVSEVIMVCKDGSLREIN